MATKLPFSKSKSNSTDEDYESDDSEIEKLKTKLVDPVEDKELIEELLTTSKTSFAFGSEDSSELISSGCYMFLAETDDDGPIAGIFISNSSQNEETNDTNGNKTNFYKVELYCVKVRDR